MAMRNKKTHYTAILTAALVLSSFTSCVKDELFNTPHPDKGVVIVTTDWSGKSAEAVMPQSYTLRVGTEEQSVSEIINMFKTLLPQGRYELMAYNTPEHIGVSGNTATVAESKTGYREPMPGYLFTAHQAIDVTADDTLRVTVPVKQLVRLLNVELSVTEGDYSRVQSATATLDGVASEVDIVTEERSAVAKTQNILVQNESKFTTSFRLLGVVPSASRTLTVSILFSNGDTKQIDSDITGQLAAFNDRTEPMTLTGNLLLPIKAGVTNATITDWNEKDGGDVDAN